MIAPTRRLVSAVIATSPIWLLAALIGWGTWTGVVVAVGLIGATLADIAALPPKRRVDITREFPPGIGVGDRLDGRYEVAVAWPWVVRGMLYDVLPRGVERETAMPQAFALPKGSDGARGRVVALPVSLVGRERGEWALGRVAVRIEGPLGLVVRDYRRDPGDRVLVAPSIANVRRYRLLAMQHRLRDAGVRVLRRRGEGTNFAGLREYAVGDDPRLIDWKASARRQTLISREFSIEQGQTVMILMDCGRLMTQLADDRPRFEFALSSALVLADIARESGDQVGLLAFDDEVRAWVEPARGRAALSTLRTALIPLRATMVEPDYASAFRTLDARQRRRALIVFYTDVIDPRASAALIAHTTRGARRHLPVVVALRNEALVTAAAQRDVETPGGVYARAAAEELLSAREEALQRMRQAGVSVIDVRPQAMTAAVVNRYLELKGRGAV